MDNMRDILNKLEEALKPSQYRAVVKGWNKERYADIFKDSAYEHDKNGYRVFIPLGDKNSNAQPIRPPMDIEKVLTDNGFEVQDYSKGIAYNKEKKQPIKIGKVLNKLGRQDLMQKFNNDNRREGTKNEYIVVISRHPYDIAGMSTDRGWTSCMNLDCGEYKRFVPLDVEKGSVIAYVTTSDDKNLNNPTGRMLIKPFYDERSSDGQVYFGIEDRVYGTNVPGFQDAVKSWVNMVNTKYNGLSDVVAARLDSELYSDSSSVRIMTGGGEGSESDSLFSYMKNNVGQISTIIDNFGFPVIYDVEDDSVILQQWNDLKEFASDIGFDLLENFAYKLDQIKDGKVFDDDEIKSMTEDFYPTVEDYEEVLRYLTEADMKKIGDELGITGEVGSFEYLRDIAEQMESSKYAPAMRTAMLQASVIATPSTTEELDEMENFLFDVALRSMNFTNIPYTMYISKTDDERIRITDQLDSFVAGISTAVSEEDEDETDYDSIFYKDARNKTYWPFGIDTHDLKNYVSQLEDDEDDLYKRIEFFVANVTGKELDGLPFDEQLAANIFTKEMLQMESLQRLKELANIK